MTHAVAVLNKVAAQDIDAYNRTVVCASDIDNGWVFELLTKSATSGEGEVWTATQTAGTITNMWMAYSPEIVTVVSGSNKYKGIDSDPRNFYSVAGEMIDAFRPVVGDIITLTADALATGSGAASAYATCVSGNWKLVWAAAAVSGLTLKYLETNYISLPQAGAISETQHVVSYKFAVSAVA